MGIDPLPLNVVTPALNKILTAVVEETHTVNLKLETGDICSRFKKLLMRI